MDVAWFFKDLSILFPKYLFYQGSRIGIIYFKDYKWLIQLENIQLKGLRDVYNSIDYIEDFLKLNEFELNGRNLFKNTCLNIMVYINYDFYELIIDGISTKYDSETLMSRLKEILDIESLNKLTSE